MSEDWVSDHVRIEERSMWLDRAIVAKLRATPAEVLRIAKENQEQLRRIHGVYSQQYLDKWDALLNGPLEDLISMMLSGSQESRDLRQCSPFAGVLTQQERWDVYRAFQEDWARKHGLSVSPLPVNPPELPEELLKPIAREGNHHHDPRRT